MVKTLVFMKTHMITPAVIEEYKKLLQSGKDCFLFVDNTKGLIEDRKEMPFQEESFGEIKIKCVLYNEEKLKALNLPLYFSEGSVMWYNCDYPLYMMRHYFPDFDYYWQIEFDCFFNGKTYQPFFEKYENNTSDLLISAFRHIPKGSPWPWIKKIDWVYKEDAEKWGAFFPVERVSGKALDVLYKKRLEHGEKYKDLNPKKNNRLHCEIFTATEIMNNGFTGEALNEKIGERIFNLNKDRLFLHPDNILYHPVKENAVVTLKKVKGKMILYVILAKVFHGKIRQWAMKNLSKLINRYCLSK